MAEGDICSMVAKKYVSKQSQHKMAVIGDCDTSQSALAALYMVRIRWFSYVDQVQQKKKRWTEQVTFCLPFDEYFFIPLQ